MSGEEDNTTTTVIVKAEDDISNPVEEVVTEGENGEEVVMEAESASPPPESESPQPQQQIYIIQTTDGTVPMESAEVVVADDLAVYETVSALQQLSSGQEGEQILQVYEEVVLPADTASGSIIDQFVDVAEVEVGDGRSASPVKIETVASSANAAAAAVVSRVRRGSNLGSDKDLDAPALIAAAASASGGGEFHICRLCNQFVPLADIADHNQANHGSMSELTCIDCGKLFKSKRSLFGHRKEKHSGVTEVHHCPECGKSFGRKSNLKAHRESLHFGKKFPCSYCERIFTNRSSMNQHIKKTHVVADNAAANFVVTQQD